jgi:hypothetical protein
MTASDPKKTLRHLPIPAAGRRQVPGRVPKGIHPHCDPAVYGRDQPYRFTWQGLGPLIWNDYASLQVTHMLLS